MKVQLGTGHPTFAQELIESAKITGLPEKAFFKSFTPRRRREIVYRVHAEARGFAVQLEVHGSGKIRAQLTMPCTSIEGGHVDEHRQSHVLAWAHNGQEAVLNTRLDHRHLEQYPCPKDVMGAFLEAIGTHKRAVCPEGFRQWRAVMQLFADRIARERNAPIEIIALLPLPVEQTGCCGRRGPTEVEIYDITDPEVPQRIHGYEENFREMDDAMTPEAMTLILLPPGYLVCRRHREIFTAG